MGACAVLLDHFRRRNSGGRGGQQSRPARRGSAAAPRVVVRPDPRARNRAGAFFVDTCARFLHNPNMKKTAAASKKNLAPTSKARTEGKPKAAAKAKKAAK